MSAFAIPRIQYKNVDTTGTTTTSSGVIAGVADTSDIEIGMFVRGTGIPTGALVLSKTSSTVTLASSVLATASATVAVAFGFEILFDFPPKEVTGNNYKANQTTTQSISGIQQVTVNSVEVTRKLAFSFLSPAVYALLETFLNTSAIYGDSFRYYDDKTTSTYLDWELNDLNVSPKKLAPRGVDTYVWEVPLTFRRVL